MGFSNGFCSLHKAPVGARIVDKKLLHRVSLHLALIEYQSIIVRISPIIDDSKRIINQESNLISSLDNGHNYNLSREKWLICSIVFSKSLLMFLFLLGQIMQILALFEGHTVTPGKFIWKCNYEMFILLWDKRYIPPYLIIICLILRLPFPLMAKYDYEAMAFHHLL